MSEVNLQDWKIDKEEALACAMAYIWWYAQTDKEEFPKFQRKVGLERQQNFHHYLTARLKKEGLFIPVQNGWDICDIFMAVQDELEREVAKKDLKS